MDGWMVVEGEVAVAPCWNCIIDMSSFRDSFPCSQTFVGRGRVGIQDLQKRAAEFFPLFVVVQ